ncbi:MAG: HD-GYP domain-containing protein [Anaerolineales bacterium]|nr:HD-GYP domain-containing protein [Anaerolineales bacterium]
MFHKAGYPPTMPGTIVEIEDIANTARTFFSKKRATLTSKVLLILIILISISVLVRWALGLEITLDLIVLGVSFFAYFTTRTKYYSIGSIFLVITMCIAGYQTALISAIRGDAHPEITLIWLVLPLLTMPLLLSWRTMLWVSLIPFFFLGLFLYKQPFEGLGSMLAVLGTGALILIFTAYTYDKDLKLIYSQNLHLQEKNIQLIASHDESLRGWTRMLEMRDKETEGHSERVTEMALKIALAMGIQDETELKNIRYGSLLHDIGKIAIPDFVLHKPSSLTEVEWDVMKMHTEFAFQWMKDIDFLRPALDIPRYHHEKWDGSGYNGLKGEDIPLHARIFSIADCWDALTQDRDYRVAWSPEMALNYIVENSGKEFDPDIVPVFQKIMAGRITPAS